MKKKTSRGPRGLENYFPISPAPTGRTEPPSASHLSYLADRAAPELQANGSYTYTQTNLDAQARYNVAFESRRCGHRLVYRGFRLNVTPGANGQIGALCLISVYDDPATGGRHTLGMAL